MSGGGNTHSEYASPPTLTYLISIAVPVEENHPFEDPKAEVKVAADAVFLSYRRHRRWLSIASGLRAVHEREGIPRCGQTRP